MRRQRRGFGVARFDPGRALRHAAADLGRQRDAADTHARAVTDAERKRVLGIQRRTLATRSNLPPDAAWAFAIAPFRAIFAVP